jgi:hypothetical protein
MGNDVTRVLEQEGRDIPVAYLLRGSAVTVRERDTRYKHSKQRDIPVAYLLRGSAVTVRELHVGLIFDAVEILMNTCSVCILSFSYLALFVSFSMYVANISSDVTGVSQG